MPRRLKIALFTLAALTGVGAAGYALALWAMQDVQPFYAEAIQAKPEELRSAGQRMESRVSALYSDAQKPGSWQTIFTAEEVNGWLATILKEKYRELLSPAVSEPRVAFAAGKCQIGFRYHGEKMDTIITVEGDAYMASNDLAAVRFRRARAGALPIPMSGVIDEVTAGAVKLEIPVRWTQQDDDPVLLIPVAEAMSSDEEHRKLERLELQDGKLLLAGSTSPRLKTEPTPAPESRSVSRAAGGGL